MSRYDNLDAHFRSPLDHRVEVVHFEPQEHAVAVWFILAIANPAVMVFHFEAVELKNQLAIRDQLFVRGASVIALAAQQTLIPPAAYFHIRNCDERLRTHPVNIPFSMESLF
jgi:hypothetical protein